MAGTLDRVASTTGLAVHFVALQQGRDDALHEAVADRMQQTTTTSTPTIDEVAGEVAASRAVIAMRYHAGILSAVGLRPSVLIGYSPKVSDLAAELGSGSAIVDNDPVALDRIPVALETVIGKHDEIAEGLNHLRSREALNQTALGRLLEPQ
jgi:polysaccharide pyruvyl transferase WcaK-like protein